MALLRLGLLLAAAAACVLPPCSALAAGRKLRQSDVIDTAVPTDCTFCGEVAVGVVGANSRAASGRVADATARNQCSLVEEDTAGRAEWMTGQLLDGLSGCTGAREGSADDKSNCNNGLATAVHGIAQSAATGLFNLAMRDAQPVEGQQVPSDCMNDPYGQVAQAFNAALVNANSCTQEALSGSSDIYAAGAPLAKQMSGEEASKEPGWCGDEEACAAATADNVAKLKEAMLNAVGDAVNAAANACT